MADQDGGRLGLMAGVGFLMIFIGITGRLGSILACLIDPSILVEGATSGSGSGSVSLPGGTGIGPNLPTSGKLNATYIAEYALRAGIPSNSLQIATAIALAESGGNIKAINHNTNGSTDYGLWQINSIHGFDSSKLLTPAYNANAAYKVSNGGTNWNPWTTYQTGAYLPFMSQALAGAQAAAINEVVPGGLT